MKIMHIVFLLCFLYFPFVAEARTLTINIFSAQNGKGLEASREILKKALEEEGHTIYEKSQREKGCLKCPKADLNIFFESVNRKWVKRASVNWFIPNPEWFLHDVMILNEMDLILCRTREVERIFTALNQRTHYIGFSSRDCFYESIEKDFGLCLHVAGSSPYKGTHAVIKAWTGRAHLHPLTLVIHNTLLGCKLPNVTLIKERIEIPELRLLQNVSGIHLCPSEAEGYGHYLMEAMSTGAIVITTDGPPMNEFIQDQRCLVPYLYSVPCYLGTRYFVDPEQLAERVHALMALPLEELQKMGESNRAHYLLKTEEFHQNLKELMRSEFP